MKNTEDKRYTIGLEFCGQESQKFVLRFCGQFLKAFDSVESAKIGIAWHTKRRSTSIQGDVFTIIRQHDNYVLLLMSEKSFRVCYGAEIHNFKDLEKAAAEFKNCVKHHKAANK